MKKIYLVLILALILPFPVRGQTGVYNKFSHIFICTTELTCLHEEGHHSYQVMKINNADFQKSLNDFHFTPNDKFSLNLMSVILRGNDLEEIYADIFSWSNGKREDMPDVFLPFYDFDTKFEIVALSGDWKIGKKK